MKLKNILTAIASSALLFAGCTQEYEISTLDEIKVSQSYICIPADGQKTFSGQNTFKIGCTDISVGFADDGRMDLIQRGIGPGGYGILYVGEILVGEDYARMVVSRKT